MKTLAILSAAICLISTIQAAHVNPNSKTQAQGFALAANHFGWDVHKKFGEQNDGQSQQKNVFFSPYSLATVMAMVEQGSEGSTSQQLRRALGYERAGISGQDQRTIANSVHDADQKVRQMTGSKYSHGNLMVVDQQVNVKDQYKQNVQQNFNGDVIQGDFKQNGQEVVNRVNEYVSQKTNGNIGKMLESVNQDSAALLVNGAYFKGEWENKAEKEESSDPSSKVFYGSNGQKYQAEYVVTKNARYGELPGQDADVVVVDYKGGETVFVGVLPRKRDSSNLAQIRNQFNATYSDEVVNQHAHNEGQAEVYLPRMEVQTEYDASETLKQLGVQDVFGSNSKLTGISDRQLTLGKVAHKAKLTLDEHGTEASAGSAAILVKGSSLQGTKKYRFDHPFLYFIRHQPTGQVLFIGEVHQL